jgi:hypothetical protein
MTKSSLYRNRVEEFLGEQLLEAVMSNINHENLDLIRYTLYYLLLPNPQLTNR